MPRATRCSSRDGHWPSWARLSGAVLTESVFNLAGVGRTMFEAITGRDYVVVQGLTLIIALIYVTVNLVVDISYGFLDPRVRAR
jgi:peptide/nickel transport system permease protein